MAQQINLYDDSLRRKRESWRAVHGLWLVAGTLALAFALKAGLDAWSARRVAQAEQLSAQTASERKRLEANGGLGLDGNQVRVAELERLRAVEAGQRHIQSLLDAHAAGRAGGYTPYFVALSRQALPSVWITGFSVAPDDALEIEGRMTNAAVLPDYLRRLDQEPQFKGRRFAQLSMKAADPAHDEAALAGSTQFVLRSQPGTGVVK